MYRIQEKNSNTDWEQVREPDMADLDDAHDEAVSILSYLSQSGDDYETRIIDLDDNGVMAHYVIQPEQYIDLMDPPEWVVDLRKALARMADAVEADRLVSLENLYLTILDHREDIFGAWASASLTCTDE